MTTTVAPDARPDSTHDVATHDVATQDVPTHDITEQDVPTRSTPSAPAPTGLGAEVRESLLLLGFAVGVTVGLTTAAQAALALLG